jgi:probable HAF family extracellular repeat protein
MKKLVPFQRLSCVGWLLYGSVCLDVGTVGAAPHHEAEQHAAYRVVNLGTLPGGDGSGARAINDLGHVVGSVDYPDGTKRPFLFRQGRMREIPVPPEFRDAGAYAINNADVILGCYENSPEIDEEIPFIYRDGITTPLAEYTGDPRFFGAALNDAGHIAGAVSIPAMNRNDAAVFRDGTIVYVAAPAGTFGSQAETINSRSVIAGEANGTASQMAFLSFDGVVLPLSPAGQHSFANDINDRNEVVGISYFPMIGGRAALYSGGAVINLGTLDGLEYSEARAINNHGVIVGYARGNGISRAFIYDSESMVDLNTLIRHNSGWMLLEAHDINNRGQIVGWGRYHGVYRAFLLLPIKQAENGD